MVKHLSKIVGAPARVPFDNRRMDMEKKEKEKKKQRLEFTVGNVYYVVNLMASEAAKNKLEDMIMKLMETRKM